MRELILGGTRSGKSSYAERVALDRGESLLYLATATAGDGEMKNRIVHHQQSRSPEWELIEEPIRLSSVLLQEARDGRTILVECLTLWLTNLLLQEDEMVLEQEVSLLVKTLPELPGTTLLVGNETGMGVVPMDALTRKYCDEAGRLHQKLAAICDRVTLVVAGLPQTLKG
ncbi:MAG: bifunctional adenosylcobinamide kinase/adenosylcobinamide-phosphate guanylyltransferase [Gammaproteobacteria bacterium]|uniref:Bifunctional adenosylcobalamin biosynthesis protein n=1 Tax=Candidatus Thiopontia autotrophica TaxID=2841688 RepID=A0A8J6NYD9_9GAMM|nr:bifunctional adenosylcobinamide kinase/adenosylcobinamide-phosphate guanylyltransferase [Candidatus Thiopontia autotrophica]MBL6968979.1 bifunctional adenosylcobinamide kinase/adenosylcobinamide-phosphate guanylyltransferase [Gammaproteobacteria bacterium]